MGTDCYNISDKKEKLKVLYIKNSNIYLNESICNNHYLTRVFLNVYI